MRHLRVPNRAVEDVLVVLRDRGWLATGMRVIPDEDGVHRLVPIDSGAPIEMTSPLDAHQIVQHEGTLDDRVDSDWWNHLALLVDKAEIEAFGEDWPSSHEFISDMMVVRIETTLEPYSSRIAEAKLRAHPHIRLVLNDEGVQGELRVRKLTPIGARVDGEIVTNNIPVPACSTRVLVRESGRSIACDPNKAYFSTKLQSERLETLSLSKELRAVIGRPINVCDPFCGVGPALATLLSEPELVNHVLASDLNPEAVTLLLDNLRRWDRRDYPPEPSPISRIFEDRIVGIADATRLREHDSLVGLWDLVIVNLPHRTIEFLPSLVPLLDMSTPSLVRGRVIVSESEILDANEEIKRSLPKLLQDFPEPSLKIKRDYSSTLRLCSFEAWIAPQ
jgi:tRNA G37 N-methylase Trm5